MSEICAEYAIRWGIDGSLEPCINQQRAEQLIDQYPAWDGRLVRRTVEYGDWNAVPR